MFQRALTLLMGAIILTLLVVAQRSTASQMNYEMGDDNAAAVSSEIDADTETKKSSNAFARVFAAPFKAVGKLFGRGNKNKVERMTEKDAAKFESAGLMRVSDSRSSALPAPNTKEATALEHLEQGRNLLENGHLNEAIKVLSLATSLDPKLTQAHSLLAVAYDRKGLHDRARASHQKALGVAHKDAQALNNSGYSLYLNGDYKGAVEYLKRAAKLAPKDQRISNNLGLAQSRLGKYDDAFKSFARAGGEFTGRMNTAAVLERGGMQVEAIKHYEAARRLQPSSPVVLQRLAQLYQRTGRPADAELARQALGNSESKAASTAKGN